MSENLDTTAQTPQGKGMAIGGFILALLGLVLANVIAVIAAASIAVGGSPWLMYVWLVLSIASVVMSGMAMGKLGKTGGKKGLAIAGLVIGIVATIWCVILVLGLSVVDAGVDASGGDAQEMMNRLEEMSNK